MKECRVIGTAVSSDFSEGQLTGIAPDRASATVIERGRAGEGRTVSDSLTRDPARRVNSTLASAWMFRPLGFSRRN